MDPITHDSLNFVTTDDTFYIVSTGSSEVLQIDRLNFGVKLSRKSSIPLGAGSRDICLLLGIINLLCGPYLILVTKKRLVGNIDGHLVYQIAETELVSFSKTSIHLSESQERTNQTYVSMVEYVLSKPGFYFSYTYDLTHTMQRRHHLSCTKQNFSSIPLYERADERFLWNSHLLQDFVVLPELHRFIVPVIHGFVCIKRSVINGRYLTFCVISRRDTQRAGVRYYRRGIDSAGNVANYIETEQIVLCGDDAVSFVQTRGSIPLHWSQKPCLKYKPPARLEFGDQIPALQKHFDQQISIYGQQVIISLIDKKGSEKILGDTFRRYIETLRSCLIWYVDFDFHQECSKMRWHRLSLLTDRLAAKQAEFGYFMTDSSGDALFVQQGVFRTNCMDCLDRTNVVQSLLAYKTLQHQLQRMGVLDKHESIEDHSEFEFTFKNVWADNADNCAKQYAGTGALKTDFTRTGKRTFLGLINDGYNSLVRYYYNNFNDGYRQDAIDLFLGNYTVDQMDTRFLLRLQRSYKYYLVPAILLFAMSMFFLSVLIPTDYVYFQGLHAAFWCVSAGISLIYMYSHGNEFVDIPCLSPISDDAI